jgi:hypothetical protein
VQQQCVRTEESSSTTGASAASANPHTNSRTFTGTACQLSSATRTATGASSVHACTSSGASALQRQQLCEERRLL